MRHNLRGRAWAALIAALLGLSLVPAIAVLEASPGSAQTATTTCPYPFTNCPTTTTSRRPHPIIILDVSAVVAGERIHLLVCGLPSGAVVRITLNGREIARFTVGDVPPNACKSRGLALGPGRGSSFVLAAAGPLGHGLTARRSVLAQAETLSGIDDFVTIPTDTAPGVYPLCAETPGADTACVPLRVLAPGSTPLFSSSGNNNSFLAFTGLGLVRLVLLAGVLLAVGWFLVRRYRQPHRA